MRFLFQARRVWTPESRTNEVKVAAPPPKIAGPCRDCFGTGMHFRARNNIRICFSFRVSVSRGCKKLQQVLNPTPLNPTPATCHKRKRKLRCRFSECCAAETALQHWLFCSAEVIWTKSCAATNEKLHCNIEKAALQESGAFLPLSCGFQAPTFRTCWALLTPEIPHLEMAQVLQKPVFALPGCQQMSVNTLLCDTLGLAGRIVLDVGATEKFPDSLSWPLRGPSTGHSGVGPSAPSAALDSGATASSSCLLADIPCGGIALCLAIKIRVP